MIWGILFLLFYTRTVSAKVYFKETFDSGWEDRWVVSDWHQSDGSAGKWEWTAGKWYGDPIADKGIQTTVDAKFFAISSEFPEVFDNKESDLVVQYSVKHEQRIDCGGAYIKILPESSKDKMGKEFSGDTPYLIMFGPDICGAKKKVHVILWHNGTNHLITEEIRCKTDSLTHVYTLYINQKNEFKVYIDLEESKSGDLFKNFEIVKERTIKDPDAKKPDDWDERRKIPDPDDVKPEGWDDIPEYIVDESATKPDEWDGDEDGEWKPPKIKNPDYKGEWKPKMIDNPNYKGKWIRPEIDNPDYVHDDTLYHHPGMKFVGFELWQVKTGTIFDNIFVGDSLEEAFEFARATWGKSKETEETMYNEHKEEERKESEALRKSRGYKFDDDGDEDEDYQEDEDDEEEYDDEKDEL